MREELIKLLPELNLIQDTELREKTLAVWEDAITMGGWTVADLEKIPFTLLIANCPVNIITHTRGVTQTALVAAQKLRQFNNNSYEIDDDILIAGGLLHDVGKILEYKSTPEGVKKSDTGKLLRHPFSGAGLAMKHGLPDKVVHIIAVHAKEGDGGYRCPEAVIVHHADFMNFEPIKG